MPSRRIILLFIAVLAMLGARRAEGQSGTRPRTAAAQAPAIRNRAAHFSEVRLPTPFPYMHEAIRPLKGPLPALQWTRRVTPRLVIPVSDKVQGSAGLVWTPRSVFGTMEIRLLLF